MNINDIVFNFISEFLIIPSILLGIYIIGGIYFYIRKISGSIAANVALPLVILFVFYYNIALLLTITPNEPLSFKYSQLLGAIYTIIIFILMLNGSSKNKKK